MRTILYTVVIFSIILSFGCKAKNQKPPISSSNSSVNTPPEMPSEQPKIPESPSSAYLKGYRDGYYGTWLAPARWVIKDDYRSGWSAGNYDRQHDLPNRFDQKPE